MAERTVNVRLAANVNSYKKAMGEASASTKKLESESSANLSRLGGKMQDVGGSMTRSVTLPLIGVAGAAIKMSSDFDSSMSKIVGLVGIAADEVDDMKASVLDLAGKTATSPQELADALFVVTSAGLRGAEAMDALEFAAKASAAGLGETKDIARAVAGAMNAYGPGVLDAAEATDILTATARAGNFETSQLAGALGKVLPFAKQAQASFEDVGGAVALLTRTNGNAAESVTQIQALMRAFVVPTAEAAEALDNVGLSAEDVRNSIGENGLVATLEMLDDKLGGNREQLGRMLGSSEAASAAFQILDADAQTIADTFGVTANAVGMVDEAFDAASGTSAQQMKQAWVDIQVAMIEVGEVIAPIAADLASGMASVAGAFSDLDPVLQKVVIGIAGLAAAAGPLLIVTGSLIRNYVTLKGATTKLAGASTLAKGSLAGVAVALTAAVIVYESYSRNKREATQRTEEFKAALDAERSGQEGATEALIANELASTRNREALDDLGVSASDVARFIQGEQVPAIQALMDASDKYGSSAEGFKIAQEELGLGADANAADFKILTGVVGSLTSAYGEATAQDKAKTATQDELTASSEDLAAQGREVFLSQLDLEAAALDAADALEVEATEVERAEAAQAKLEDQTDANAAAMDEWSSFVDQVTEAHQRMVDEILGDMSTMFDYESATLAMATAYDNYKVAVEETTETLKDSEATDVDKANALRDLRQAEIDMAEQAYATAEAYAEQQGATEGTTEWADLMTESLDGQADAMPGLRDEIDLYIEALAKIPRDIQIGITTHYKTLGSQTTPVQPNVSGQRAMGGPTSPGHLYEVNENGSELFTENGRTYLMSSMQGFVTPIPAGGNGGEGGSRTGVHVEHYHDESGHALQDVFRVANAHLMMGV